MQADNISMINTLVRKAKLFDDTVIEATVIEYIKRNTQMTFFFKGNLSEYEGRADESLLRFFEELQFPSNVEFVTEFFEALLEENNIIENGIVFTPEYIADYIFKKANINISCSGLTKVLDPSCGCGIFLASAAKNIRMRFNLPFRRIISECIYGIELDHDNARRCEIVLNLLPLFYGETNEGVKVNISCQDSLKCSWSNVFSVKGFDLIIGNPPYVNTHDMTKETAQFLKKTFITTKSGVYNIFYAFIEHAMGFLTSNGMLSYIVPNNFLTIKSASELRKFISENGFLSQILDFANNMVFRPVRTYNCIIQLTSNKNEEFKYSVMGDTDDIEKALKTVEFDSMPIDRLDVNGWKLIDKKTRMNIQRIESQMVAIKGFIKTGIATLRDEVYMVNKDENGYYKNVNGLRFDIEDKLIKRVYKIPELKENVDLKSICRYIIFPYKKGKKGHEIIDEKTLREQYSKTYNYLLSQKYVLDERDKGKGNPVAWYAYGRTQGLNNYGVKLLFPTFANRPRFVFVDDETALFCNGYAVFQNSFIDLDVLRMILNSIIMQYYVQNTSYAIEGGYYCYQKKYIERFSVPYFTPEDVVNMRSMNENELNDYLIQIYGLVL